MSKVDRILEAKEAPGFSSSEFQKAFSDIEKVKESDALKYQSSFMKNVIPNLSFKFSGGWTFTVNGEMVSGQIKAHIKGDGYSPNAPAIDQKDGTVTVRYSLAKKKITQATHSA